MELNQYFFSLIVSICVIHLAAVAGDYLSTLRTKLGTKRSQANNDQSAVDGERDDWYVFFHCADLLGKESKHSSPESSQQEQPARALPGRPENTRPSRRRARL
jgi:hypothetical protein